MRRFAEERRSNDKRGSSDRNSSTIRDSKASRGSSDVRNSSVAKLPSKEDIFFATGCLKGEVCYETPKSIHRLFEEILMTNASQETTALIYEGKLRN